MLTLQTSHCSRLPYLRHAPDSVKGSAHAPRLTTRCAWPPIPSRTLQGRWVGPAYRLLSRNCNHFSRALCGALLAHPSFKAAPGKSDPLRMVPRKVTRLSSLAAALRCCTGRMDS